MDQHCHFVQTVQKRPRDHVDKFGFHWYSQTCKKIQKVFWIRFDGLMFKVHIQCKTNFPLSTLHFWVLSSVIIYCLSF